MNVELNIYFLSLCELRNVTSTLLSRLTLILDISETNKCDVVCQCNIPVNSAEKCKIVQRCVRASGKYQVLKWSVGTPYP